MKVVLGVIAAWLVFCLLPIFVVWGISSFADLSITPVLEWHPMTRAIAAIWVVGMTLSFVGFIADYHYN